MFKLNGHLGNLDGDDEEGHGKNMPHVVKQLHINISALWLEGDSFTGRTASFKLATRFPVSSSRYQTQDKR